MPQESVKIGLRHDFNWTKVGLGPKYHECDFCWQRKAWTNTQTVKIHTYIYRLAEAPRRACARKGFQYWTIWGPLLKIIISEINFYMLERPKQ